MRGGSSLRISERHTSRMERYPGLPALPERIRRLEELACDLWWSWHYRARDVFRRLDYPLWRETAHNPVRMLRLTNRDRLKTHGGEPRVPRHVRQRRPRPRRREGGAGHVVVAAVERQGQEREGGVLLGRVRAPPVAAALRGRSRRPGRGPLQGSERPRHPAGGDRVHVPAGLLPPARVGRRLAAGDVRTARLARRADRARRPRRRDGLRGRGPAR